MEETPEQELDEQGQTIPLKWYEATPKIEVNHTTSDTEIDKQDLSYIQDALDNLTSQWERCPHGAVACKISQEMRALREERRKIKGLRFGVANPKAFTDEGFDPYDD